MDLRVFLDLLIAIVVLDVMEDIIHDVENVKPPATVSRLSIIW